MLTASLMYWSLQQSKDDAELSPTSVAETPEESPEASFNGDDNNHVEPDMSDLSIDDVASDNAVIASDTAVTVG